MRMLKQIYSCRHRLCKLFYLHNAKH